MFFQPHKRSDDRWVYVCCPSYDSEVVVVGYCAGGADPGYHDDGHATSDEACACYRAFEIATALEFVEESGHREPCAICGDWTTGRGRIRSASLTRPVPLCSTHQTPEDMTTATT